VSEKKNVNDHVKLLELQHSTYISYQNTQETYSFAAMSRYHQIPEDHTFKNVQYMMSY